MTYSDSVLLFTPIPRTQAHTVEEFVQTFARLGVPAYQISPEPAIEAGDESLISRALSHVSAVRSLPNDSALILVLWPAFGWLEPALWAAARRNSRLIIHDPIPLRRQYGQGRLSRAWARNTVTSMKTKFICHTDEAALATIQQLRLEHPPSVCLHPILTQPPDPNQRPRDPNSEQTILVAGQYKPSRDLDLLSELGPRLRASGLRPRIVGRGWPTIDGWEIESRFLTEREFETEIRSAAAIVVPYQRYWQSGVAIQALEREVPVVGAATAFLRTLFDDDYPGLVHGHGGAAAWLAAISAVVDRPPDLYALRRRYQDEVDKSWGSQVAPQST